MAEGVGAWSSQEGSQGPASQGGSQGPASQRSQGGSQACGSQASGGVGQRPYICSFTSQELSELTDPWSQPEDEEEEQRRQAVRQREAEEQQRLEQQFLEQQAGLAVPVRLAPFGCLSVWWRVCSPEGTGAVQW